MNIDPTLLPFYFGSLNDQDRLKIEQRLLTDPEILLDYLDLKREFEDAGRVPQIPSRALWIRLAKHFATSKRTRISLALGLAVAAVASLLCIFFTQPRPQTKPAMVGKGILFDSGSEQFGHSNVL